MLFPREDSGFLGGGGGLHSAFPGFLPFSFATFQQKYRLKSYPCLSSRWQLHPGPSTYRRLGARSSLIKVAAAPGKLKGKIDGMDVAGASQQCH